ncbi:hypothetical protein [Proteiniphilum sp. UBA1028]|jgi:hypothetical protein|uniref:hypothetical protein n=1 Tax=Proteiniphilum sp. UBA1028 TaxID=1947251 RepID=UPI0025F0A3A7|nr:hypothetical protein [Proteiniphilum sp. UBA1028]
MDFVDMLLNRIDGESELKKPTHALVCFTRLETGRKLCKLASDIVLSKTEKSSITLLHFIANMEAVLKDEPIEVLQHKLLADLMPKGEKSKITVRLFIREYADLVSEIRKMTDEQGSNLLLIGLGQDEIGLREASRYMQQKNDPAITDAAVLAQFGEKEASTLKQMSSLLDRNRVPTGIFLDNGLEETSHIFIPVLCKADMHIFTFVYQTSQMENVQIMVWDAVGIIQSEAKMQKLYQFIVKKSDGRVRLWDDNKKIEKEFIRDQDLLIIGIDGWSKLVAAPLPWKDSLPSTLIIKDSSN